MKRSSSLAILMLFMAICTALAIAEGVLSTSNPASVSVNSDFRNVSNLTHLADIMPTGSAEDWNDTGHVLFRQGKYDEAILAYDNAIRLDPNMPWPGTTKATLLVI